DAVTGAAAEHRGLSENRLRQLLTGDLATIAQKCLNPRPKDRYPSIDSLTVDVQRYLGGRPVLARPQTTLYRFSKFIRRNRGPVAAAMLVAIALLASVGYPGWRPEQAQMGLAESMYENGDLDSAQKVLTETIASAKAANDFPAEAESEAFSGNIAYLQGQMDAGESLTAHALDLSRKPSVTPAVRAWSAIFYAWNRENNGYRSDENVRLLQSAVKECRDNKLSPRETADALYTLGEDLELRGRLDEAESAFDQDLQVYSQDPFAICEQSEVHGDLAYVKEQRGDVPSSIPL